MLNKYRNKLSITLLACLLLLSNTLPANQPPVDQATDYLELADKSLKILLTLSSIAVSYVMIKTLLPNSSKKDYIDWTDPTQNQNTSTLTQNQENFLINLLSFMEDDESPHAVIIGNAGSGKTTIVRALASKITNKNSMLEDTSFKEAAVWSVDADTINGSGIIGQAQKRLKIVWEKAKNHYKKTGKKVILFFDEFHRLVQMGNYSESTTSSLSEVLKTLTGNKADYCGVHLIGATTTGEYTDHVERNGTQSALTRRFPKYEIPPMSQEDALSLLINTSRHQQKKRHVFILENDLVKICKRCIQQPSKEKIKHPNPSRFKKIFTKIMISFTNEKRKKEMQETKKLYEDISYLERRIDELTEKETWVTWLKEGLWFYSKNTQKVDSLVNPLLTSINNAFINDDNQESKNKLEEDLWRFKTTLKNLNYAEKKHARTQVIQKLTTTQNDKKSILTAIRNNRNRINGLASRHASLINELKRLTAEKENGRSICTSKMTNERYIDKAIYRLQKEKIALGESIDLSSVQLTDKKASSFMKSFDSTAQEEPKYLSMYT